MELPEDNNAGNIVVCAPRAPVFEVLITFFTFGLYAPFWLVSRVRELKALSGESFKPWLWFFVPWSVIFQFFALPKFFNAFNEVASKYKSPSFSGKQGIIIVICILATFFINLSNKLEFPPWMYWCVLLVWGGGLAYVHRHFNFLKLKLDESVTQKTIKYIYKPWEWLLLFMGAPLVLFVIYIEIVEPPLVVVSPLNVGDVYTLDEHFFQFSTNSNGWSEVEVGTHSDGSGLVEFSGPLSLMHYIVFHHGHDETLDSVSYWRQRSMLDESSSYKCRQSRSFIDARADELSVASMVVCNGTNMGDPVIAISKTIATKKGVYEIYGYMSSGRISFKNHEDTFIEMAESFKPL